MNGFNGEGLEFLHVLSESPLMLSEAADSVIILPKVIATFIHYL